MKQQSTAFIAALMDILDKPNPGVAAPAFTVYSPLLIKYGLQDGCILCILLHELEANPLRDDEGYARLERQRLINNYNIGEIMFMSSILRLENDGILQTHRVNRQTVLYRIDVDALEELIIRSK